MHMALAVNDYTVLKSVRAVCPRCFSDDPAFDPQWPDDIADGHLVTRDGKIYLRRYCRRGHGEVWSLYEEDLELWQYLQQWRVPTKIINADTRELFPPPIGYEHGLGPAHLQHTCIFLLDITSQCNLSCPACYAQSGPKQTHYLPVESILRSVHTAIEREGGRLDVVMISGGEPTVHPQIVEILRELAALPVTRVLLNTNGIRIASDKEFVAFLHDHRKRIEVYLQYDGQREQTHIQLRGQDLREIKRRVLERLSAAGVFTTLVMVVTRENQDLIGEVLDTALGTPFVGGVMFQPVFGSGRAPRFDSMDRVTTTGVLRRIESQCSRVKADDLIALPCSHPDCCSIGYVVKGNDGSYRSLARLVGHDVLRANLGVVGNTIAFADTLTIVRDALAGLMSESMTLSRPELVGHLASLCTACDFGGVAALIGAAFRKDASHDFVGNRVKRITIKHFMDADTLISERLEQCCVHVGSAGNDPVRMPFCAARLFPKVRSKALEGATTRAEVAMYHGG
ncbi:MAG: radical SAM protein [Candidatus Eremiobacteraeota bacterium]|nr:radical SAM protein [Candidatus Eremiobacteraeota bacterium]